jgi:hypothetical protein
VQHISAHTPADKLLHSYVNFDLRLNRGEGAKSPETCNADTSPMLNLAAALLASAVPLIARPGERKKAKTW